ncbi:MAG: carbohydrate ABC transporter substrate-binding protein [Clostridiales bacterium]|nr:carbohydrate ABC transporter substrate-binding protein [Clostridiales bacterium]
MKMKRFFAVFMALIMVTGTMIAFTGCNKQEKRAKVIIEEADPWFGYTDFSLEEKSNARSYSGYYFNDPIVTGNNIIVSYSANNYDPDKNTYEPHDPICIFDMEGNLINEIEISDKVPNSRFLFVAKEDERPVFYYGSDGKIFKAACNETTGELEEPQEADLGIKSSDICECRTCGDYVFATTQGKDVNSLIAIKDGEIVASRDITEASAYISKASPKDSGYELIVESNVYFFDPEEGKIKSTGMVTFDHYDNFFTELGGNDGRTYCKKADGIYVDDEPYFMFNDCYGNIATLLQSEMLYIDDSRIVLMNNGIQGFKIIVVEKEDTNPNAGKTVITASAPVRMLDTMSGEGIKKFNQENGEFFVRYRSDIDSYFGENEISQERQEAIAKDITSSDSADIYFDVYDLWSVMSEDYFIDLNKELTLDEETYYTTVTDSMSQNGHLFSVPTAFSICGLITSGSNVPEGKKGLTFDEYKSFVSDVGNGTDAISELYDRNYYFKLCFSCMSDIWFTDGKIDITNESFEQLCEFFKDVPEYAPVYDDSLYTSGPPPKPKYDYEWLSTYDFAWMLGGYKDATMLGIPSSDGRGVSADLISTLSVSSMTSCKEGCIELIKTLLSEEVQEYNLYNPFNRKALKPVLEKTSKRLEEEFKSSGYKTEAEAAMYGYYLADDAMIENYIKIADNVATVESIDPEILRIVLEEIGAYFADQKDIKEVEKTLQDRLDTLYSEKYSGR